LESLIEENVKLQQQEDLIASKVRKLQNEKRNKIDKGKSLYQLTKDYDHTGTKARQTKADADQ